MKNCKFEEVDCWKGDCSFTINCGRFGYLAGDFTIDWEFYEGAKHEVDGIIEAHVKIYNMNWTETDALANINKRNVKEICEFLEQTVLEDPEAYGYESDEPDYDNYEQYLLEGL